MYIRALEDADRGDLQSFSEYLDINAVEIMHANWTARTC